MKKQFNPSNILFTLTILVSILFIVSLFSSFTADDFLVFFNSDTLYLPILYKDLFINHIGIQGWYLSPSPYFFPDMIVYFILMFITGDFIVASFLYPIIQYVVFLVLILKLYQLVLKSDSVLFASFSNIILLLFFLVTFCSHDFNFTFFLVSNSYHIGAFLMSLLCLILTIKYLENPRKGLLINLAWIGFLSVLSDGLFVVMYYLPIICIILIYKKIFPSKKIIRLLIINISVLILGITTFIVIKNSNYIWIDKPNRILDFRNSWEAFKMLIGHMHYYLIYGHYTKLILILSLISFLSVIWILINNIRKERYLSAFAIYCFLTVIFTLIVFFAPVINGNYTASDSLRYNISVFYISMLNIPLVIAYLLKGKYRSILLNRGITWLLIICLTGAFWIGFNKISISGLHKYFHYYPSEAEQMDSIAKEHRLFYGVGNYWPAKCITMFSKCGVRILPVFDDMFPYFHTSNKNWFFAEKSVFNYIILFKFVDRDKYKKIMGTAGIKADSSELEIMLLPKFRYDPKTFKPYLVDSTEMIKTGTTKP